MWPPVSAVPVATVRVGEHSRPRALRVPGPALARCLQTVVPRPRETAGPHADVEPPADGIPRRMVGAWDVELWWNWNWTPAEGQGAPGSDVES